MAQREALKPLSDIRPLVFSSLKSALFCVVAVKFVAEYNNMLLAYYTLGLILVRINYFHGRWENLQKAVCTIMIITRAPLFYTLH